MLKVRGLSIESRSSTICIDLSMGLSIESRSSTIYIDLSMHEQSCA